MNRNHHLSVGLVAGLVLACFPQGPPRRKPNPGRMYASATFPGRCGMTSSRSPATENAWWLLGGTALTIGVYQFEDPERGGQGPGPGPLDRCRISATSGGTSACRRPWRWAPGASAAGPAATRSPDLGFDLSRGLLLDLRHHQHPQGRRSTERGPTARTIPFPRGTRPSAFTTAGWSPSATAAGRAE